MPAALEHVLRHNAYGNEHRAHGTTILGANGRTPPKISAWSYGIANGISRNGGD